MKPTKESEILALFELAREFQITLTHLWVMVLLKDGGRLRKKDLAAKARVSSASMTIACDVLELAGLIEQRVLPKNRRTHEVWLSDRGITRIQSITA